MQTELNELQPVLAVKTKDTQRLLAQVGMLPQHPTSLSCSPKLV